MRSKKILTVFIMVFIMLFAVGVKADWNPYFLEKENSYGSYFDFMPTEVKKGDIITVKVKLGVVSGNRVSNGEYVIRWDDKAFELIENKGMYYKLVNENIRVWNDWFEQSNKYTITFEGKDDYVYDNNYYEGVPLFELKFRVLNNAKDGVYSIYQTEGDGFLYLDDAELTMSEDTLKYQIGKSKIVSGYTNDMIENDTYIIGEHMFTREGSDEYNGQMSTEYIMLASKSIDSNSKEDMIVYHKSRRDGSWKNAITNDPVTQPTEFKISYVDMIPSYSHNGIYSNDNESTIVSITQINEKDVIVSIECAKEEIHGLGTINGNVVQLSVHDVNYKLTINNNEVAIETSDSNIKDKKLQKYVNFGMNEYFDFNYGNTQYLKSELNGKYTAGNYDVYFFRATSYSAYICIKGKNDSSCKIKETLYLDTNDDGVRLYKSWLSDNSFTAEYKNGSLKLEFDDNKNSGYNNSYTKETKITMDDIYKLFEENYAKYLVLYKLDADDDDWYDYDFVNHGDKTSAPYYIPRRADAIFVEWQLNGKTYDFNKPVTEPLVLVAKWEDNLLAEYGTPELINRNYFLYDGEKYGVALADDNPDKCAGGNGNVCDMEYGELYEVDQDTNQYTKIMDKFYITGWNIVKQSPGTTKYYALRGYKEDGNGKRIYTPYSEPHEVDLTNADAIPTPNIASLDEIQHENGFDRYKVVITNEDVYSDHAYNYSVYTKNSNDIYEGWPDITVVPDSGENGKDISKYTYVDIANGATKVLVAMVHYELFGDHFFAVSEPLIETASAAENLLPVPTLSESMGDYGWSALTIRAEGNYATEAAIEGIDGWELYTVKNNNYTLVIDNSDFGYVAGNVDATYAARVYTIENNVKKYSPYSNRIEINNVIPEPVIHRSYTGASGNSFRMVPLYFEMIGEEESLTPAYEVFMSGTYGIHLNCSQYDSSDCTGLVEDYDWFEKDGTTLKLAYEGGFGGEANVYVPEGTRRTFVAKAYVHDPNNKKVYSDESNEVTIDLTNPTYTFETYESPNNSNKVGVRVYINGYEITVHGIKIGGTVYDEEEIIDGAYFLVVDKTVIENVNTIILGVDQPSQSDPSTFVVERTATRGTNVWSDMDTNAIPYNDNIIGIYCYAGDSLIVPKVVGQEFTCNPVFEGPSITNLKFDINTGNGIEYIGFTVEDANKEIKNHEILGNTHRLTFNSSESYFEYAYRLNFRITDISNPSELYVNMDGIKFRTIGNEYYSNPLRTVTIQ